MRIVIDGRMSGAAAVGGIGRYTEQLLFALQRQQSADEYIVLVRPGAPPLPQHDNWRTVAVPWHWYSLAEQYGFPKVLRQLQPDIVHFPHFNVPLYCPVPYVVTIHDLLLQQFPARRPGVIAAIRYWPKYWVYRYVCRQAVRRARAIIAVSHTVKEQLIAQYRCHPALVTVIANGLTSFPPATDDSATLLRYTVNRPFMLYVGNAYPHKNVPGLLAAFALVARQWSGQLVLVGPPSDWFDRLPAHIRATSVNTERVRVLSAIPDSAMAALYRQAAVLVQPSLAEGFGLTGLEAMSVGCPVVCNDLPVFREVYGEAARYTNATIADHCAAALLDVLTQPAVATTLRAAGTEQVKQFSWDRAASAHQNIYHACQKNQKNYRVDST